MARPSCPLPQVEEALKPYIHERHETLTMRQQLASTLRSQVEERDVGKDGGHDGGRDGHDRTLTQLSLVCPAPSLQVKDDVILFKTDGVYRRYLQALMAHGRARARYEAAKTDLSLLRQRTVSSLPVRARRDGATVVAASAAAAAAVEGDDEDPTAGARDYLRILKQRQQCQRMEIVQAALKRLVDMEEEDQQEQLHQFNPHQNQHPADVDLKASIKEKLGPPPEPPASAYDSEPADAKVDELAFRLKTELLASKARMENAEQDKVESSASIKALLSSSSSSSSSSVSTEVQVLALQRARAGLIAWIESQLSRMPEEEAERVESDDEIPTDLEDIPSETVNFEVAKAYKRYVSAREVVLENVEAAVQLSPGLTERSRSTSIPTVPLSPLKAQSSSSSSKPALNPTAILPYLSTLLYTSRDEAALMQQTTFLRRQLNLAGSETKQAIQRLAGESLLVPPDTSDMASWSKAVDDADEKTADFVGEQVTSGGESVQAAREGLGRMTATRTALEHLKGNWI